MVYTLRLFFPFQKCSLFHDSNVFGSCIIHILYTGCAKIKKKKFRRQKVNQKYQSCTLSIDRVIHVISHITVSRLQLRYVGRADNFLRLTIAGVQVIRKSLLLL